jgi:chromosome segregation ATPase
VKLDVLALPFDQYQRYRLVADLLSEVRAKGEPLKILDVGGRTALLRAFLPKDDIVLVDLEASRENGLVLGDGSALPFRDATFDVVAAFDTLEHVLPSRRAAFVAECARVAKRWIVIAGPYQSPEVEEAEKILQRFLVDKLGVEHRYLEEHRHNGLPSQSATEDGLRKAGARVASIGHGNIERWLALMCLAMYMDYEPRLRPLAARVFRFYNASLYASDHAAPVYRHAVVGALAGAPLPLGSPAGGSLGAPAAPPGVLSRFREVADEMVAFDRARADWHVERARLQESLATLEKDLAGHRASLAEVLAREAEQGAVIRTLERDLAGHAESLASATSDLESERKQGTAMRAELQCELDEHRRVVRELERDLEEHKTLRTALENAVEERRAVVAELEADLEGHRAALADVKRTIEAQSLGIEALGTELEHQRTHAAELETSLEEKALVIAERERDLASHKAVLAAREGELGAHREALRALESDLTATRARLTARENDLQREQAVTAALGADLEGHRRVVADLRSDLDGHRALAADLRREIEAARRAHEGSLHELNLERQKLERTRAELDRAAEVNRQNDATIGALRAELRNRWRTLKRALGPRRPIP